MFGTYDVITIHLKYIQLVNNCLLRVFKENLIPIPIFGDAHLRSTVESDRQINPANTGTQVL